MNKNTSYKSSLILQPGHFAPQIVVENAEGDDASSASEIDIQNQEINPDSPRSERQFKTHGNIAPSGYESATGGGERKNSPKNRSAQNHVSKIKLRSGVS